MIRLWYLYLIGSIEYGYLTLNAPLPVKERHYL